ncbi:unnamed protein product [Ectocarpus sp. CCAP 1310/34]|nr:unnamed protein product [Ectocarpus sp. CCAP 1310/34]
MSSTRPKRRPAPSAKALDLARDEVTRREVARAAGRVGFAALGQQHARDLEAGGGEEQAAGRGDDDVQVVAAPAAKQARVRKSTKWPPTYDFALARAGLQNEVWIVNGSRRSVGERWDTCWETLNQEPLVRMFKDKASKNCKSRYDKIVDDQSKSDGKALRDSGAGTAESGSEDDVEKNTKVQLDKVLTAIVDAKAAARQDSEETKQKKADQAASHSAMGMWAINQGNARCGPGAKATSFEEAVAANNIALGSRSGAAAGGRASGRVSPASSIGGVRPASEASAGGAASGRSSPTMSTGGLDDDLSPAGSGPSRKVPPLGELVKHMGSLSIPTLAQSAGVTTEEADYFLNTGFTVEVQPERAVAMTTVLLDKRLSLQRDGDSVQDYMDGLGEEDMQLPGFDRFDESVMVKLLELYGVEMMDFRSLPESN